VHRAPDANAGGALIPNGAAVRAPTQPQSPKRRGSFLELVVVLKTSADAEAAASAKQVELDARCVRGGPPLRGRISNSTLGAWRSKSRLKSG
jgi:hypothetical protein